MTPYDFAMAGIVIAGMIWGAIRGITWQIASIASLLLGYAVAMPVSAQLAPKFPGEPVVARGLALLAVYVAVSGAVYLVAWLIRATLRQWRFEDFDRHLGMILGGLEGALLGLVGTVIAVSVSASARHTIMTSHAGQIVGTVLNVAQPALPGEVSAVLAKYWEPAVESEESGVAESNARPDTEPEKTTKAAPSAILRGSLEKEGARLGREVADAIEDTVNTGEAQDGPVKRR
jgi:membrane protein required for colicin V production